MARICNDARGCLGVQGGHGRKTLSFSGAPCALKQPSGQARHAAREFELEQLHLQRGRIEAGARKQRIQAYGVETQRLQQGAFGRLGRRARIGGPLRLG